MSAPMEPVFGDPPPPGAQAAQDKWMPTRDGLIKRSSEWALILVGHYVEVQNLATSIRKSRGAWTGHAWEATARNTLSRTDAKVWARHIKPLDTPNDEGDEHK
ncbi:hypothetical protein [Nonomuraea typhae]|uniref:hypothetical protein n=1 Tax=Nonomuraea typhae TaxID=2603600 RepID=UPI0012F8E055|nr:hypothetical protein [Nonomuraea typhae]